MAQPRWWWVTLIGPPLSFVALLVVLWLWKGAALARAVLWRALVSFFLVGRVSILEPTEALSAEALFALVVYMDLAAGFFIAPHVGFLFDLPWLGRRLMLLVEDSEAVLGREDRARWLTFLALVAFVFVPVTATGSVGGAVLGRLLGLSRTLTLTAVAVGSVLSSAMMYAFAGPVRAVLAPDALGPKVIGVALVSAVFFLLGRRYRAAVRRIRTRRDHRRRADGELR